MTNFWYVYASYKNGLEIEHSFQDHEAAKVKAAHLQETDKSELVKIKVSPVSKMNFKHK